MTVKFFRLIWNSGSMTHDMGTFCGTDLRSAIAAYCECRAEEVSEELLSAYAESIEV